MNPFHDLEPGSNPPEELNMIVENPKGCMGKFELDKKSGLIMLDRVSYSPLPFPFEYGLIPRTWNKYDNDPMDIMCVNTYPTFSGCIVPVRIVGLFKLDDTGEIDHKAVAVPLDDPHLAHVKSYKDIGDFFLREIEFFWGNYKQLMPKKYTKVLGWEDKSVALDFIKETLKEYEKKFGKK